MLVVSRMLSREITWASCFYMCICIVIFIIYFLTDSSRIAIDFTLKPNFTLKLNSSDVSMKYGQ